MRQAPALIALVLSVAALAACGDDKPTAADATTPAATGTTAGSATTAAQPRSAKDGCTAVPPPQPATDPSTRRSKQRLSRNRIYTVVMRTNCGTIRIRLDVRTAPKTTSAFAGLVRKRFFDGLTFHRIASPGGVDFVIQGGDPLGTGNGGPGYAVREAPPRSTTYKRYSVAMAKTGAEPRGTSGSQFFIVTGDGAALTPDYAILGRVVGSTTAVKRIARLATDPSTEMPLDPVVMRSVRLRSAARG